MLFKMVIQKNSDYQTGADKQIPIFCIPDESDIIVDNSKDTLYVISEGGGGYSHLFLRT